MTLRSTMNTSLSRVFPSLPLPPHDSFLAPSRLPSKRDELLGTCVCVFFRSLSIFFHLGICTWSLKEVRSPNRYSVILLSLPLSVQTISGTGANHLGALFLSRFYEWNGQPAVGLSNPTWGTSHSHSHSKTTNLCRTKYPHNNNPSLLIHLANHHAIFKNVGITPVDYPYYDPATIGLAFHPLLAHLGSLPERSVILLHACAHNPTGVDPTPEQWNAIADKMLEKKHYAFFDCAYQGFASGDLEKDASAVSFTSDSVFGLVSTGGLEIAMTYASSL